MKRFKRLTIFICFISFLYGCAVAWLGVGAGVGIGTYKYIEGNLIGEYPLAYSRAWDATNEALENLKISITNSMNEASHGKIDAVRKDGKKVVITVKDKGLGVSSISVRVGILGDRVLAQKILDEIASLSGVQ